MEIVKSIILSAGRSCFVKCPGCYNFFGKSSQLTKTEVIVDFLSKIPQDKISKITVGGGDPLTRSDIVDLLSYIKILGFEIYMDTVGSALISNTESIFYGSAKIAKIDAAEIAEIVNLIGIPLDGSNQKIANMFRIGRETLFDDQLKILTVLNEVNVKTCVNTVVHPNNYLDLKNIYDIICHYPNIIEWQVFQFMPIGPLGYKNRQEYIIDDLIFDDCIIDLKAYIQSKPSKIKFNPKSRIARKGKYLLIDTDGYAWSPSVSESATWEQENEENKRRKILGNINDVADHDHIIKFILGTR